MKADLPKGGLLLLSGGVDSTALIPLCHPAGALFIDYGQRPARAERRAASAVAMSLGIEFHEVVLDLRPFGGGMLLDERVISGAPSPEWWPFRNQMLVTAGAAVALRLEIELVITGTVKGDGDRHVDGTPEFFQRLNQLLLMQEGRIRVETPGISDSSEQMVIHSGLGEDVLGWTVSCHRSELPCGRCPGCWKRKRVMANLGILQGHEPGDVE